MKKADLNTIFTAKVNELLAKGYIFHTETMAGHQGEIAKVDLTNGEEVIRVVMEEKVFNWDQERDLYLNNSIIITVGRAAEVNFHDTIWNKDLEVLDQEIFYQADYHCDYLITEQEAIENAEKHKARLMASKAQKETEEITDKATIKALVPYIQTLNGCKSVKARHLAEVRKEFLTDGTYRYTIRIEKKSTVKVEILSQNTLKNIRKGC